MAEGLADQPLEQLRAELVIELQLGLARGLGQGLKSPDPGEMSERPVAKLNHHLVGAPAAVLGREMRVHTVVAEVDAHQRATLRLAEDPCSGAPGEEARVVFDALDQIEHLPRAVGHEHRFLHACHLQLHEPR